jgi:hypothetical protein
MACERLYARSIFGQQSTLTESASRGIEVHQVLSTYVNHLVSCRRASGLAMLESLMRSIGTEAQTALARFRDNHSFDPES